MSSTTASSLDFQTILNAALSDYATQTGIDLATHPFAQTVRDCNDADAVFNLLQDRANQFLAFRDGNRKLIDYLKPVVQVLCQVSAILCEAPTSVSTAILLVWFGPHFFYIFHSRFHFNQQRQFSLVSKSSSLYVSPLRSSSASL